MERRTIMTTSQQNQSMHMQPQESQDQNCRISIPSKGRNRRIKNCVDCDIEIIGTYKTLRCVECSDSFSITRKIQKQKEKFTDVNRDEWVECPICSMRLGQLMQQHLSTHDLTIQEFKLKFPEFKLLQNKLQNDLSSRLRGPGNPGFNHGGRLQPFSKNFVHYTEKTKDIAIEKQKKTKVKNSQNNTTIEFFTSKGLSEEEAKLQLKARQTTFSLKKCIDKYGEELGNTAWKNRQNKWQETLTNKSDDELARINRSKMWKSGSTQKLEEEIYSILRSDFEIERQFQMLKENRRHSFSYDMKIGNVLIEINGDYWHANPVLYESKSEFKRPNGIMTSEQIWQKDEQKRNFAISKGFLVYYIWEKDFHENKEKTIELCKNYLTQYRENSQM